MVAVYVVDGATSQVLVNIHGEDPVQPASNNKLITTAAAMSLLGEDYRFHTRILAGGKVQGDGTLMGDLVIEGGGDPTISGRFAKNKRDVTEALRGWVAKIREKVRSVRGNVVVDDSCFEELTFHPTWLPRERAEWYEAEVSGLSFNDNCVDLAWSAKDKLPGDIAAVTLNPRTAYVSLANEVKVAAKGRPVERYYRRGADDNSFKALGSISIDNTKDDSAAVHDGALYMGTVFKETATSEGLAISGKVLHRRGAARAAAGSVLVDHVSPPLADVIKVINLNSQNFYAECVCKTLGRERGGSGSWKAGTGVAQKFAADNGIFHEGQVMVDGCGLSAENRTTARQLVETVRFMDTGAHHVAWRATLPIGATRGSLRTRFQQSSESRILAARIYGKTGLIGGVRSLSGLIDRPGRAPLYYSIVLNRLQEGRADEAIALIDRIALMLADLP
jgi:D-alanyl-D-alanine carboxypeptidase/D-alanyl-D-alanine-endopeptidase (penicillin-binding protein 4)